MPKTNALLHAFNVGVIDKDKLPRVDLAKLRLAAETQTNWLCDTAGKMFMRPGFGHIATATTDGAGLIIPFIRAAGETALIEISGGYARFYVDDEIVTRPAVTSTITNGLFASATGWTTTGEHGGTSTISGGYLTMKCPSVGGRAKCKQAVSTSSVGTEHALRIVVERGPVLFRCGSTDGDDDYISETELRTGGHSLAFTPSGGTYYVQFTTTSDVDRIVERIVVESAGVVQIDVPYGAPDLQSLRYDQSIDVLFVACPGFQQRRIEHRNSGRSWSVARYQADDGPFKVARTADTRLKPAALNGNTTLTAESPFFTANHVGALFRLFHSEQHTSRALAKEGTYCDAVKVTGVTYNSGDTDRRWYLTITGTWVGTVSVYRSYDGESIGFQQYGASAWTANTTSYAIVENNDNAIIYYRAGFKKGNYTSGTATVSISYSGGGGYGICRVTGFTSSTEVDVEVLRPFRDTEYTSDWREGEWSAERIWPSSVGFFDGRVWWGGKDRFWGSISDAYESFDEEMEGDAGPIARSVVGGGVSSIRWVLPAQRLVFGTDGSVFSARSSSLDEPLSPTNIALRDGSTNGASNVGAVKIDSNGVYVDASGRSLFELLMDDKSYDYKGSKLSKLASSLFTSSVKYLAVQRRPDTRIWIVLENGNLICCIYEPTQNVLAFVPFETDGVVGCVAVLPSEEQDSVYIRVERTIDGAGTWVLEKMAFDSDATPGTVCKCVDSFVTGTNAPASTTISGLGNLIGEEVVAWADGDAVAGTFTVSAGGTITVPSAVTQWAVGRPYTASYKSARLAYGAAGGSALTRTQRLDSVGLIVSEFHRDGLKVGRDLAELYPLPEIEGGTMADAVGSGVVMDERPYPIAGSWTTDERLCITCESPYPAHVLGAVVTVTTNG